MAMYAGEIMLKSGAETYRVEDTIIRLCRSRDILCINSFVTPTGIFISAECTEADEEEILSSMRRIKERSINLNKVTKVNDFSRKFVESQISVEEAVQSLNEIDQLLPYPYYLRAICGGMASAFVSLLFGANFYDFFAAMITSIMVMYTLQRLTRVGFPPFLTNISGGTVAAFLAIFLSFVHPRIHVDIVIIGAVMVMVPGVAITNAIRDSIGGDLVSGLARAAEALVIAISIAFGVGIVLNIWGFIMGGSLI